MAHNRPADGDTLALTARQILGLAVHQVAQFQNLGGLINAGGNLGLGVAGKPQGKAHVFAHGHMRIQRVGLKHHRDAAFRGVDIVHPGATDGQVAAGNILQPGDHPQQGGFATAGRADKHHELFWQNLKIDAFDYVVLAISFAQSAQFQPAHGVVLFSLRSDEQSCCPVCHAIRSRQCRPARWPAAKTRSIRRAAARWRGRSGGRGR